MKIRNAVLSAVLLGGLLGSGKTLAEDDGGKAEGDLAAAAIVSLMFPGAGEWYNTGFKGGFPWGECIIGTICPCVRWSSMMDAAAGKKNDKMRLAFWSAPK